MDLVGAIRVSGMLAITEQHIRQYEVLILRYLRKAKDLYLESTIKNNHHLALHFGEFLRRFGPVHAWRTFVFERFNHLLQNLSTNRKRGTYLIFNILYEST